MRIKAINHRICAEDCSPQESARLYGVLRTTPKTALRRSPQDSTESFGSRRRLFHNRNGFTLIEFIIAIGFFAFISAVLMHNLFSIYHFKEVIRYQKDINFEASSVLNSGIPGLIRSGFTINYADTIASNSSQPSEGLQDEADQISIFTDRAETQYFTIFREPYKTSGDESDTARLMIKFSNGDEFPIHTSETVIEDFDVEVPTDPRINGDRDNQPYVTLYIRVRHRYPFGDADTDEDELMAYRNVRASYKTTYSIRNNLPGSYKNNNLTL